jgi:hypothetical protein
MKGVSVKGDNLLLAMAGRAAPCREHAAAFHC